MEIENFLYLHFKRQRQIVGKEGISTVQKNRKYLRKLLNSGISRVGELVLPTPQVPRSQELAVRLMFHQEEYKRN